MVVVAGPPGSGKTRCFPVSAFGVDSFNIDDRCAQISLSKTTECVGLYCTQLIDLTLGEGNVFA
jgi:hypothetical protein